MHVHVEASRSLFWVRCVTLALGFLFTCKLEPTGCSLFRSKCFIVDCVYSLLLRGAALCCATYMYIVVLLSILRVGR